MKMQVTFIRFHPRPSEAKNWNWENDVGAVKYQLKLWGAYPLDHTDRALNVELMRSVNFFLEVDDEAKNFALFIDKNGKGGRIASGTIDHNMGTTVPAEFSFWCVGKDAWGEFFQGTVYCHPPTEPSVVVEKQ